MPNWKTYLRKEWDASRTDDSRKGDYEAAKLDAGANGSDRTLGENQVFCWAF